MLSPHLPLDALLVVVDPAAHGKTMDDGLVEVTSGRIVDGPGWPAAARAWPPRARGPRACGRGAATRRRQQARTTHPPAGTVCTWFMNDTNLPSWSRNWQRRQRLADPIIVGCGTYRS